MYYSSQLHKSSLFGMSNLYLSNDPNVIQIEYVVSPTLLVLPKSLQKDQVQTQEDDQQKIKMESQSEDHQVNITLPSHLPSPSSSSSSRDHDGATKKPKVANINITLSSSSSFSSSSFYCSEHHDETKDKEDEEVQSEMKYDHSVSLKREFNEMFVENEDGYQTPTSPSCRIPRVTECPPAPRKAYRRRRVMNKRYIELVSVDEIGDNFSPLRKKARVEAAIAN